VGVGSTEQKEKTTPESVGGTVASKKKKKTPRWVKKWYKMHERKGGKATSLPLKKKGIKRALNRSH